MHKPLKIAANSTEYIGVKASYLLNGSIADPTDSIVKMAFVAPNSTPIDSDWVQANWESSSNGKRFYVLCLLGPQGAKQLTKGFYNVWVQLNYSPELIRRKVGSLTIV